MGFGRPLWWTQAALLSIFLLQEISCASARASSQFQPRNFGLPGASVDKLDDVKLWNVSEPNFNLYHRSDVLLKKVKSLVERHPQIMSMEVLKGESDGYKTEITVVTVEAGGRKSSHDQKMRLLLDFGQHGRELVTSEVAFRLLQTLGGERPVGEVDLGALKQILPHTIIKIVPMENLNGRRKVEAGEFCERKNGRGVDINRNWAVDWGKKEKDYDPSEEYPGPSAFSEPETVLVRDLAMSFKPHVWVNVHSGMEALFMPYDHRSTVPTDGAGPMKTLLQTLNRLHCMDNCVVGSGGGSVGYLAHGTATDYMYDVLKIPMAFTWEIYGDLMQPEYECFQMFNPASPALLQKVISRWSDAFFTLIVNLPAGLRRLPTRTPAIPVWNWESFTSSGLTDIPDKELRSRLTIRGQSEEASTGLEWGGDRRSESADNGEGEKLLLEFSLLFTGVVLMWVFSRLFRCFCTGNQFPYSPLGERTKRVPV
ncbi:hypothetical protein MPTK1_6g20000 [Marchantia polymorpha subsp. ruderalis]|uniref:Peptidase M14 domain-containing protein n=4 Tax=Marchantia polymorpha TaxID=3197 RepID=A0A176VTZ4_MARPO|nr:hypothetical protein AXG93_1660s1040 [Marchantia polymorpha subsp. ruderalis]PTQ39399.1 hypothetical protein MARPO_0045s0063 [Marchantia polymorpha]PTQ39400.1 hypothetical protein MARPO_0045s0063 [Marchantia polymorpha]BBN15487.1 hypothetical protein Mp_6g20000 [Marchantia polymorpha subsp. ruderalis]BBN15488.1 hypothetical protein Mp_6g20000 [Marchantia polymorpha subsp. ruderalis]|eukprot:PTQ39399.1 hypothetical protein MARPO_0045s0063 [Marchantia polymorpha]